MKIKLNINFIDFQNARDTNDVLIYQELIQEYKNSTRIYILKKLCDYSLIALLRNKIITELNDSISYDYILNKLSYNYTFSKSLIYDYNIKNYNHKYFYRIICLLVNKNPSTCRILIKNKIITLDEYNLLLKKISKKSS